MVTPIRCVRILRNSRSATSLGSADPQPRQDRTARFDGHVSKPIDPRAFAETVTAFVPAAAKAESMTQTEPRDPATSDRGRQIRVLLVDEHRLRAEGVAPSLSAAPEVTVTAIAADGSEALQAMRRHDVDVVLLGYRLPDQSGAEVARMVRALWPATRIIMVTANDDGSVAAAAIAAGCHGLVPEDRDGEALLQAVRSVHEGLPVFDATTVVKAIPYLRRRGADPARRWHLTARESEVLVELAAGLPTAEIARVLQISPVTVRNHIQRILAKLDAHSRLEAVSIGVRAGLLPADATPGIDQIPDGAAS